MRRRRPRPRASRSSPSRSSRSRCCRGSSRTSAPARRASSPSTSSRCIGLNILTGLSGQVSLGHGAFMAVGGYVTAILVSDQGLELFGHTFSSEVRDIWTLPLAGILAGVAGLLFGLPATRLAGAYLALATFGIGGGAARDPAEGREPHRRRQRDQPLRAAEAERARGRGDRVRPHAHLQRLALLLVLDGGARPARRFVAAAARARSAARSAPSATRRPPRSPPA